MRPRSRDRLGDVMTTAEVHQTVVETEEIVEETQEVISNGDDQNRSHTESDYVPGKWFF